MCNTCTIQYLENYTLENGCKLFDHLLKFNGLIKIKYLTLNS